MSHHIYHHDLFRIWCMRGLIFVTQVSFIGLFIFLVSLPANAGELVCFGAPSKEAECQSFLEPSTQAYFLLVLVMILARGVYKLMRGEVKQKNGEEYPTF